MFLKYVALLQFLGLLALSGAYKLHPVVNPDIPANTDFTTGPFVRIGTGYYFIESNTMKNWYQAYETCRAKNAELITIETIEEWNLINQYLRENNIDYTYWTSGSDLGKKGSHIWFSSGKPIDIQIWSPGQPDNKGSAENCDDLGYKDSRGSGLNDRQCAHLNRYICETAKPVTASFVVW